MEDQREEIQKVFRRFAVERLRPAELQDILCTIDPQGPDGAGWSREHINMVIALLFHRDADGSIHSHEFVDWLFGAQLQTEWKSWCEDIGMMGWEKINEAAVSSKEPSDIRLLQWNILADALSTDGFLTLPVGLAAWPCAENNLPTAEGDSTPFLQVVNDMVDTKSTGSKEEQAKGLIAFKAKYDTEFSRLNDNAVLAWRGRLIRMKQMIQHMQPDLITLQEVDHLHEMQEWLGAHGYSCGSKEYIPMGVNHLSTECLLDGLHDSGIAYAPHVNSTAAMLRLLQRYPSEEVAKALQKMMKSSPDLQASGVCVDTREDLKKCVMNRCFQDAGGFKELLVQLSDFRCTRTLGCQKQPKHRGKCSKNSPGECIDDDVQVIFWKRSRFQLESIEHMHFTLTANSFAVKVTLKDLKMNRGLSVITTHLKSGALSADEDARISKQLLGPALVMGDSGKRQMDGGLAEWMRNSSQDNATILAMDANSRPQFEAQRTVWKLMTSLRGIRSVWAEYFDHPCTVSQPVSVNKCRGPGSKQPQKVGSHAYELIDHVFYSRQLSLRRHALKPISHSTIDKARADLIPSVQNPSDHFPVLVDIAYR